jgi:hypothetical protein
LQAELLLGPVSSQRSAAIDRRFLEHAPGALLVVPTRTLARRRTEALAQAAGGGGFWGEPVLEFNDFAARELQLVETLRTLRILHHAAWLASRWSDPAFPRAFTWFGSERFWSEHILELREQFAALQEPPLELL